MEEIHTATDGFEVGHYPTCPKYQARKTFSNDKQLIPGDVRVRMTKAGKWQAFLAIVPVNVTNFEADDKPPERILLHKPKIYMATGPDKVSAINMLIHAVKESLDEIRIGDGTFEL